MLISHFFSHINPIHSSFKSYRFHTACIQFDLAQRFNHPFPSSFHDWNSEVEEKQRNKNKDLKKKKQNVGSVYTSKGEGWREGFSEVLDWILRRQTSKESSLVFAILCIGRDGI